MTEEMQVAEEGTTPARLVAEMQDEILSAGTELERLERLLTDAFTTLMSRFSNAHELVMASGNPDPALLGEFHGVMTALQFQDMSSQLIAHARRRLGSVADCLAGLTATSDEEVCQVQWVQRACPVAQRAVDAGSIELF